MKNDLNFDGYDHEFEFEITVQVASEHDDEEAIKDWLAKGLIALDPHGRVYGVHIDGGTWMS